MIFSLKSLNFCDHIVILIKSKMCFCLTLSHFKSNMKRSILLNTIQEQMYKPLGKPTPSKIAWIHL